MKQIIKHLTIISIFALLIQHAVANPNQFHQFGIPISNIDKSEVIHLKAAFAAEANDLPTAARKIFDRLLEKNPRIVMAKIGQIITATSNDEYNALVIQAQKMTGVTPGEAMLLQTYVAFIKRDLEQYLATSKTLSETYPNSSWAWRVRGSALGTAKQIDASRNANDKAINAVKGDTLAFKQAANNYIFFEPKNYDKAQMYMEEAIETQPANSSLYITLGDVFRAKNNLNAAKQNYQVAATLSPQNSVAFSKQGHANTFLGFYNEARENYLSALSAGDKEYNMGFGNFHAYTYLYEGKPKKAISDMKKWIKQVGKSEMTESAKQDAKLQFYNDMALSALKYNMLSEAEYAVLSYKSIYEKQMKGLTDTNDKNAFSAYLNFLQGMVALKSGDPAKATLHAETIMTLMEPMNNTRKHELYHNLVGQVELHNKNYSMSLEHLKQADQADMNVKYHIAMLMDKMGKNEVAKSMYNEIVNFNFNDIDYALIRNDALKFN